MRTLVLYPHILYSVVSSQILVLCEPNQTGDILFGRHCNPLSPHSTTMDPLSTHSAAQGAAPLPLPPPAAAAAATVTAAVAQIPPAPLPPAEAGLSHAWQ